MSVSPVSNLAHPAPARPTEALENPATDHDADGDESAATVRPVSGQPAPGGGVYL